MKKRILSIVLVLCVALTMMSTTMTAFADSTNPIVGICAESDSNAGGTHRTYRKWLSNTEYKDYKGEELLKAYPGCWILSFDFGNYTPENFYWWISDCTFRHPNVHTGTNFYISKFYPIDRLTQEHVDWVEVIDAFERVGSGEGHICILVKPIRACGGFDPDYYDYSLNEENAAMAYHDLTFSYDITINGKLYEDFLLPERNMEYQIELAGKPEDAYLEEIVGKKEKYNYPFITDYYRTFFLVQDDTPGHNSFLFNQNNHAYKKEFHPSMECTRSAGTFYIYGDSGDALYGADYCGGCKVTFKPADPNSDIMDYVTITRDYDGTAVDYQYDEEGDYYWFYADGYNVTISAKYEFATTADSGYYAPDADSDDSKKSGIIAFTSCFTNLLDTYKNCNFGKDDSFGIAMFSTESADEETRLKTSVSKTTFSDLKTADGYFYSFVKDISSANFDNYAYALPFATINGKTVWGKDIVKAKVNDKNGNAKWLGGIENAPQDDE